jgi:hypothetical protein
MRFAVPPTGGEFVKHDHQLGRPEGLPEEGVATGTARGIPVRGQNAGTHDQNNWAISRLACQGPGEVESIAIGQANVKDDEVRAESRDGLAGRRERRRLEQRKGAKPGAQLAPQDGPEERPIDRLVLDHEDP